MKLFKDHLHGYEKNLIWASSNFNGRLVSSGSSDKLVYIWDTNTRKRLATLGGHTAVVNQVAFSPKQDLIVSASSDNTLIVTQLPELY